MQRCKKEDRRVIAISVKIKISYERPNELQQILRKLEVKPRQCKSSREQKGQYKRAYVQMDIPEETKLKNETNAGCSERSEY